MVAADSPVDGDGGVGVGVVGVASLADLVFVGLEPGRCVPQGEHVQVATGGKVLEEVEVVVHWVQTWYRNYGSTPHTGLCS